MGCCRSPSMTKHRRASMITHRRAPLNPFASRLRRLSGRVVTTVMAAGLTVACEKPAPPAAPPTEVYVTDVVQQDVPVYLDLVGQTQGFQDVEIRARVEGFLETVNFREGSLVRKGDLLYDDRSQAARGDSGRGQGRPGHRPGEAREGQQRRRALHAARGETGRQPAGAGQRARRAGRGHVGSRSRQGGRGEGDARLELHAHHVADRRAWSAPRK